MGVQPVTVITVDGPGGSGKGTITQMLARKLGWHLLDSGALYRLTALAAERQGVALDNEPALVAVAASLDVTFEPTPPGEPAKVLLAGEDVNAAIRTEQCGNNASKVAVMQSVRDALLQRQRDFRKAPGLVADGRDMGTVVFPDAPVKIFLTASAEERAQRRFSQLLQAGVDVSIANVLEEIRVRDERDMNRSAAPLKPADDAQVIDSTGLSIEEVLDRCMAAVGQA
ncbi:(d)CMP kinase [Marinobacter sp. M3C]|jgi:cytidylate kinase|uniref:(d)CMP kinase n=1 Tax=unclassified Marinobacter TaxID=83889 RepID=UPI00200DC962|nr:MULTISPECIES: (d)CMP kinase [unclassified Marinobacter]MCL1478819.1 (d)CMP kinase [Marinobacter sp.]MCL1480539.1 (d)CMP kinase [Marinobacter sp.]MCL1484080.1 (d)CMP kinase [Marinobacter sp.]MCL1487414.1 (d)CMP kinase [Marinobacter sp.]UQG57665.1 (d)CMP kinase [Marinobacter sp. M4C]